MKRGDLVTIAASGDYGKPRPALIIQSDWHADHPSITLLPITSDLYDLPLIRIDLPATKTTGLRAPSQVMVDKTITVPKAKVGNRIGHVDPESLSRIGTALIRFLELG